MLGVIVSFVWEFIKFFAAGSGWVEKVVRWILFAVLLSFACMDKSELTTVIFTPPHDSVPASETATRWSPTLGWLVTIVVVAVWAIMAFAVTWERFAWLKIEGVEEPCFPYRARPGHRRIVVFNRASSPIHFSARLVEIAPKIDHHAGPFLRITGSQKPYQVGVIPGRERGYADVFVPLEDDIHRIGMLFVNNDAKDLPVRIPRCNRRIRVSVFAEPPAKSASSSAEFDITYSHGHPWEDDLIPVAKVPFSDTAAATAQFLTAMVPPAFGIVFGGFVGLVTGGLITISVICLLQQARGESDR
jgi:hypothetical protein